MAKPQTNPAPEDHPAGESKPAELQQAPSAAPPLPGNEPEPNLDGAGDAETEHEGAQTGAVVGGVDPDAPYGRRLDGTPMGRRGRPPKLPDGTADERGKQKARLRSVTPSTAKPKPGAGATVTALAVVNYQAMGESVASLWFNGGTMLLGKDWEPDVAAGEPQAVAGAFRDYFKATNMRDLPPALGLAFVLSVYTLSHAQKPTVQSRLQAFGAWVKSKMPKRNPFAIVR